MQANSWKYGACRIYTAVTNSWYKYLRSTHTHRTIKRTYKSTKLSSYNIIHCSLHNSKYILRLSQKKNLSKEINFQVVLYQDVLDQTLCIHFGSIWWKTNIESHRGSAVLLEWSTQNLYKFTFNTQYLFEHYMNFWNFLSLKNVLLWTKFKCLLYGVNKW